MYLFDMVAELAIAERVIGLAIELTRIVVTRASQLFTTIAWICGFCVGTISTYMDGATGIDSDSESNDVAAVVSAPPCGGPATLHIYRERENNI
eukprot:3125085-Amphidinium_carterae.1